MPIPFDVFPKFYPVMPDLEWIELIAPLGIKVVQLRLKDVTEYEINRQVEEALNVCARHDVQLIVNDYWEAALALGADYIHLGQEDLARADLAAIRRGGLKIGISTHSQEELEIALKAEPDYIALGPVYETILKKMKWQPQGLDKVSSWKSQLSIPLIAIGGINLERAPGVLAAGADSVAVVTDIVISDKPGRQVSKWVDLLA